MSPLYIPILLEEMEAFLQQVVVPDIVILLCGESLPLTVRFHNLRPEFTCSLALSKKVVHVLFHSLCGCVRKINN